MKKFVFSLPFLLLSILFLSYCTSALSFPSAEDISEVIRKADGALEVYSGNDDQIVPILSLGGIGVISVLANIAPKETHDLVRFYLDGNGKKAAQLQLKYMDLIQALFCEVNPIPVKKALELMGFRTKSLRMPLTEMEEKNVLRLKTAMKERYLIS